MGQHYALVAERQGLRFDSNALDRGFAQIWGEMPFRPATGEPREDDDKGWWRDLVDRLLDRVGVQIDRIEKFIGTVAKVAATVSWVFGAVTSVKDILTSLGVLEEDDQAAKLP